MALQELENMWEHLNDLLRAFEENIEDQKASLMSMIDARAKELGKQLEQLYEAWQSAKPKARD